MKERDTMKKKIIAMSALTLVFMLILPVLPILAAPLRDIVPFVAYLFLPYLICPLCAIAVGIIAGTDVGRLGYFAVFPALVALGAYTYLMDWEAALILSGCYLTLGLIAMGITALIKIHLQKKRNNRRR